MEMMFPLMPGDKLIARNQRTMISDKLVDTVVKFNDEAELI